MALSSKTIWEVRTTGSDNNGGGFVADASGTDRSQQDAAHASGTNLTVHASTNTDVLPDGHTPDAADVGNIIQITAGTGWTTGFYEIKSIQSGYWRLDRSPAAATTAGGTWAMGGALASVAVAGNASVAGNDIWVKKGASAYSITSASAGVSGGVFSGKGGTDNNWGLLEGYETTRGDGIQAEFEVADGISPTVFTPGGHWMLFKHLKVTKLGAQAGTAFTSAHESTIVYRCSAFNFTNGMALNAGWANKHCNLCYVEGCSVGYAGATVSRSTAKSCTTGFSAGGPYMECWSWGCSYGFGGTAFNVLTCFRCVAYKCTTAGFSINPSSRSYLEDCITWGNNSGIGINSVTSTRHGHFVRRCYAGNHTTNYSISTNLGTENSVDITILSADPFVDGDNGNFTVAATALRGVAFTWPGSSVSSYPDIGAVQHADPSKPVRVSRILSGGSL